MDNIEENNIEELDEQPEYNLSGSSLHVLVQFRDKLQKERVAFGNRLTAFEQGRDIPEGSEVALITKFFNQLKGIEAECSEDIRYICEDYPIIEHMCQVKGVGKLSAAQLVAYVDITKCNTVSGLWRYCGWGNRLDGSIDRFQKGVKGCYNKKAKQASYKIGTAFIKFRTPYRNIYDNAKEVYAVRVDDEGKPWTKGHIHNAAMRKMIKIYLAHLWFQWRELEGLPTRVLYVQEYLGHTHLIERSDFGWLPINSSKQ